MGFRLNAAIAESIITTTKEKTDKEISHDTANALNKLSDIFDKKKIEEKQELVNLMSQTGFTLIGDIADRKEKQKKPEKRITAYWRRNTKKKQRNGAKAEPIESPCMESWEP